MTYLSVTFAMILALLAIVLWGIAGVLLGLLKIVNGAADVLVRASKRLLKWI